MSDWYYVWSISVGVVFTLSLAVDAVRAWKRRGQADA